MRFSTLLALLALSLTAIFPTFLGSAAAQHTGTTPATDVGFLLGLWEKTGSTTEYGVYRTLWITRVNGNVQVDQAPNLLVPRKNGFWEMGSNVSIRDDKKEEFLWLVPLGKPVHIHELTDEEAKGLPDEAVFSSPIMFLSGDYIALEQANYDQFESFHTYSLNDNGFEHALDLSSVAGANAGETLVRERDRGKSHMSMPVSMQDECQLEGSSLNWAPTRHDGHWFIKGWAKWTDEHLGCSSDEPPDYVTSIRAPRNLVGFDELPVTWDQIAKTHFPSVPPGAADAFGPPTRDMLVVLTGEEVLVCPVTRAGIGSPIARTPLLAYEEPVMAQWAVGKFVASWNKQFENFRKNPGPHDQPPDN